MSLKDRSWTEESIEQSVEGAKNWLSYNNIGYPRSWTQEDKDAVRRGYDLYEETFEAPTIVGYERLERLGLVKRVGIVTVRGQERIKFYATPQMACK